MLQRQALQLQHKTPQSKRLFGIRLRCQILLGFFNENIVQVCLTVFHVDHFFFIWSFIIDSESHRCFLHHQDYTGQFLILFLKTIKFLSISLQFLAFGRSRHFISMQVSLDVSLWLWSWQIFGVDKYLWVIRFLLNAVKNGEIFWSERSYLL